MEIKFEPIEKTDESIAKRIMNWVIWGPDGQAVALQKFAEKNKIKQKNEQI